MAPERLNYSARRVVPYFHGVVERTGPADKLRPIRRPGHRPDIVCEGRSHEGSQERAGVVIPETDAASAIAAHQHRAVGGPGDRKSPTDEVLEDPDPFANLRVPDFDRVAGATA